MAQPVARSFESEFVMLPVAALLLLKKVDEPIKLSSKYLQIARSVAEIGIIEPLVVARHRDNSGRFLLLDGHIRHAVLVGLGVAEVRCLVSLDDEGYTFNKRISRLATIQEHFMIVRAIERGVPE